MSTTTEIKTTRKRATMGPSNVVIQHTTPGTRMSIGGPGSTLIRRTNVMSYQSAPAFIRPSGEAGKVSKEAVQNVMGTRGKEKKDLSDLNSKLADYIEKVRFVEATNKALTEEVERLRKMKGYTQARVKEEYEEELEEARSTIKELSQQLAPLQAKNLALEDQVESKDEEIKDLRKQRQDLENQIQKLTQMLGELEGETATLRHQLEAQSKENDMLKQDIERLREDNNRIRNDYEVAVQKQIEAQNERDALAEELSFIKDTSEAEITELRELLANFQSVQPKIEKMWQSEFKGLVQELQANYNQQLADISAQQQRRFDEQLISIQNAQRRDNTDAIVKSENKTLKSQIGENKNRMADLDRENARLRAELEDLRNKYDEECRECEEEKAALNDRIRELELEIEGVIADLNELRSSHLDLELEISCYKKLLEGEESKIKRAIETQVRVQSEGGAALAGIISGGGGSMSQTSKPIITMSESTGHVRVSRSSKCAVSIKEIDLYGRYIMLSNSSKTKDFDLSNWVLEREHPKGKSVYNFDKNFKLGPDSDVKIFSDNYSDDAGPNDLKATKALCRVWGHGNGKVSLKDENNQEKANSTITYS